MDLDDLELSKRELSRGVEKGKAGLQVAVQGVRMSFFWIPRGKKYRGKRRIT